MSKNKKFRKLISWPKFVLVLFMVLFMPQNCYSYYDVPDSSRPLSAFSICCCLKESDDGLQSVYSCKYIENDKCPISSRQYKTVLGDCPSNLMFTKYTPEQNKDSKDN